MPPTPRWAARAACVLSLAAGAPALGSQTLAPACRASPVDTHRVDVLCGVVLVRDVDVDAREDLFVPVDDPWRLDVRYTEPRPGAPPALCSPRSPAVADTAWTDAITADVQRVFTGGEPLCFDVPAAPERVRLAPDPERTPEELDRVLAGLLEALAHRSRTAWSAPRRPDASHRTRPVRALFDDGRPISEEARRYAAELRRDFDVHRDCRGAALDHDRLRALADGRPEGAAIWPDYGPLVSHEPGPTAYSVSPDLPMECSYDPRRELWSASQFTCTDTSTCFQQWEDGLPRDCQTLVRSSKEAHVWVADPDRPGCFGGHSALRTVLLPLGKGVYAVEYTAPDETRTYAVVFAPGSYEVERDLDSVAEGARSRRGATSRRSASEGDRSG